MFLHTGTSTFVALLLMANNNANAQFLEYHGVGFCKDSEGVFYARGQAERFDDPQACLDHCLLLDDSDLVGFAYKSSNKRCHCNYNAGSEVIANCDRSVFTNGCRSNQGYTGSGIVISSDGPPSWRCFAYDPSPTFAPESFTFPSTTGPVASPVAEPVPMAAKKGVDRRNLQTSTPVASPIAQPTPSKGTKKGRGSKNKGKRMLQTSTPSVSPVIVATPVSEPAAKGIKKGSGQMKKKNDS
ncbi:unnamed protein product [Cylindrotheca closterium]|uniref:WSC domain-containing protein n=1 Tax=Cylindrotheca closterium TaxID=2856 RepID=A0AAD2G2Z0_9STRA|nr:unnamed protein product [Cylindrotheca closterium]